MRRAPTSYEIIKIKRRRFLGAIHEWPLQENEEFRMMKKFDRRFIEEMKNKLEVDLLGAVAISDSTPALLKEQVRALLPGAKSVFVFAKEMYKEIVALLGPSKEVGAAERGDLFGPHGDYLNSRLTKAVYDLAGFFRKEGYKSLPLPAAGTPVDQRYLKAIFSFKDAAREAGMGSIGRHGLLITPQYGPRVRLACLLTDAKIEPFSKTKKNYCVHCDACLRACPAQVLQPPKKGEPYAMNKFACRTYRQAGLTCSVCLKACAEVLN
jgi:epoxyqueuosine reductase QueG